MSTVIGIGGDSKQGKTTSLRNLPPKESLIINVVGKPFGWENDDEWIPFDKEVIKEDPNAFFNMYIPNDGIAKSKFAQTIDFLNWLKTQKDRIANIRFVGIDDFQYLMGDEYISRAKEQDFSKFQDIAQYVGEIVHIMKEYPTEYFFITSHLETDENTGKTKFKTAGKAVDKYITLEGRWSYVLYAEARKKGTKVEYSYRVKTNGKDTCGTPIRIPDDVYENDLYKFITEVIEKK